MLRRDARLRKEFLYKKAQERDEAIRKDKQKEMATYLEKNQALPGSLKQEAIALTKETIFDPQAGPNLDDEYLLSATRDPKIMITTSRDPSSRLLQFAKELRAVFPNSQRINRGNGVLKDIVASCKSGDFSDLIIVHEHRGTPDGLIVSHFPHGPTAFFSLVDVVLRHDSKDPSDKRASEAYPHLVVSGFTSTLGSRVSSILRHLFPAPTNDTRRIISFVTKDDYIHFRNHLYRNSPEGPDGIVLKEMGPRFALKPFQIKQGTLENDDADIEWVFRPYLRTTKKRTAL